MLIGASGKNVPGLPRILEVAERKRRWNIVGRDETAHAGLYRAMIELD
jgi:hypothetical protein